MSEDEALFNTTEELLEKFTVEMEKKYGPTWPAPGLATDDEIKLHNRLLLAVEINKARDERLKRRNVV